MISLKNILVAPLAIMFLVAPCMASAALINVSTQDIGLDNRYLADLCSVRTAELSAECVSGPQDNTDGLGGYIGTGFAEASADGITGELRVYASSAGNEGGVAATAQASFSEIFTVSGTGIVEAFLNVEGTTALSTGSGADSWQVLATLSMNTFSDFFHITSQNNSLIGNYNETVSASGTVRDGDEIRFNFSLLGQIGGTTSGVIDFGNTARALITTSAGVTLTPENSLFLSAPTFGNSGMNPNPVSEPGSLALFAIGVVFAVRRRGTMSIATTPRNILDLPNLDIRF